MLNEVLKACKKPYMLMYIKVKVKQEERKGLVGLYLTLSSSAAVCTRCRLLNTSETHHIKACACVNKLASRTYCR